MRSEQATDGASRNITPALPFGPDPESNPERQRLIPTAGVRLHVRRLPDHAAHIPPEE